MPADSKSLCEAGMPLKARSNTIPAPTEDYAPCSQGHRLKNGVSYTIDNASQDWNIPAPAEKMWAERTALKIGVLFSMPVGPLFRRRDGEICDMIHISRF
jgi:hypothetical protein